MATSFSGGGSRRTRREPPNMGKQPTNIVSSNPAQARCTQYNIMW